MKNTKQRRKIELFARLSALGFTYEESAALRRIEMTLQRWGELECGNDRGCIERDEKTGKPFMTYDRGMNKPRGRYAVADRERGALKRLARIVLARNLRECPPLHVPQDQRATLQENPATAGRRVYAFHQGDCRGCNLYLLTHEQLLQSDGTLLPIEQYYTRGLAVCD